MESLVSITSPLAPGRRRNLIAGGALAWASLLGGCEYFSSDPYRGGFTPIDQPQLEVVLPRPGELRPDQRNPAAPITIRNGKGEVLVDAVPDEKGRISRNFPLDMNDGTIVVEQRLRSGDIDRQTYQTTPGRPILLREEGGTGRFTVSEPPPVTARPQGFVDFLYGGFNRPNSTRLGKENGTSLTGTAFDQDNRSSGFEFKLGYSIPLARDSWLGKSAFGDPVVSRLEVSGSYGYAESSDSQDRLGANGEIFRIYTAGAGFATGQDLANLDYNSEFREAMARAVARKWYMTQSSPFPVFTGTTFGFSGGKQYVDETLSFRTTTSNTQFSQRQKTDSTFVGMPIGGGVYLGIGDDEDDDVPPPWARRYLYVEAGVEPRYNWGDTRWSSSASGFADRNADLSKNEFTVGAELRFGLKFGDMLGLSGYSGASPLTGDIGVTMGTKAFPQVEYTDLNRGDGGAKLDYKYGTYAGVRMGMQYKF